MSISQDTKNRICQFSGKTAVGGYIKNLVSEEPPQPDAADSMDATDYADSMDAADYAEGADYADSAGCREHSNPEPISMLYRGFITIGISAGALIGYFAGGGRKRFLSGGWADTAIGIAAGMMIGIGFGRLGHALICLNKKNG